MSELSKLLEGVEVEWKAIEDIFYIRNGYTPSKANQEYWKNGTIPWFRMEDIRENGRVLDKSIQYVNSSAVKGSKLFPANSIIVATSATIGEHALITVPFLSNQRFTNLSLKNEYTNKFIIKFLFYYGFILDEWCKKNVTVSNFAGVDMNGFKKFLIPIPPLSIQQEIVRILDTFTERTESLINELTAELEARKKQYNYYREKLLSFKEGQNSCLNQDLQDSQNFQDKVEWKTLGEITRVFSASRVHKNEWTTSGVPFYRTSDVISIFNGVKNSRDEAFISNQLYETLSLKSGKIQKDDILVTGGGTIGIPYIVPSDEPLYFKDADLLCIKKSEILNSKFLYHYFLSTKFRIYLDNITHNATIAHYTISQITKTPVPVPPLEVQARIVVILDKFNLLIKSISEELPKEIALRKKQYEYYRDRLLTFK